MSLDRDGRPFIAAAAVPALVALAGRRLGVAAGLAALPVAVGAFFRDPHRHPDRGHVHEVDLVVAPADGKVMHAGPPEPGATPPGEWQQVAIFLSLADVHINRAPYGGTITDVTYRPGRFRTAFSGASGVENERTELRIVRHVDGQDRTVVFRQVVGLLARRVVTRVGPGDTVATGERIGLMKFGSRMDVFVPPAVELCVAKGDRVVAGETILARWPPRPDGEVVD
ncbi:MAG: phosphatidylserine decarboxylase [Acidimicrobiales bacterium]